MALRRMFHAEGCGYRFHKKGLPGRLGIVFASERKAIFVHGCFWHGHQCSKGKLPKSKLNYWRSKIEENKARDTRNVANLEVAGWKILVVWQCEIADEQELWPRLQ